MKSGNYATSDPSNASDSITEACEINISPKSKLITLAACLLGFLGIGGIHLFYTEKTGRGFAYLFTIGLFGIGTIIDLIKILSDKFTDANGLIIREAISPP